MASHIQKDFTVKFGRIAHTIDYDDSTGHILFTLDVGSKVDLKSLTGPIKNLCLEYYAPRASHSPNYDIAFERVKQHLESLGYEVEIYGE